MSIRLNNNLWYIAVQVFIFYLKKNVLSVKMILFTISTNDVRFQHKYKKTYYKKLKSRLKKSSTVETVLHDARRLG